MSFNPWEQTASGNQMNGTLGAGMIKSTENRYEGSPEELFLFFK